MSKIIFNYKGISTNIECKDQEKMKDIFDRFKSKIKIDNDDLVFLYNENIINKESKFEEIIDEKDKKENKINVLVNENNKDEIKENNNIIIDNKKIKENDIKNENKKEKEKEKKIIKSNEIICPECGNFTKIKIDNYNIDLGECENKHKKNNILFNEFEDTQKIDLSKIICDVCKERNKANNEDKFFKCFSCSKNLCSLCKNSHDKTHKIVDYEEKNYICERHNDTFVKYCTKCEQNICMECEIEHKNHNLTYFGELMPNKDKLLKEIAQFRIKIDEFNKNVNDIIKILNNTMDNIEIYYNLCNDILNNFEIKKKNYYILQNIKEIFNYIEIIKKDLNKINNEKNLNNKIKNIINISNAMTQKQNNNIINLENNNQIINNEENHINIENENNIINEENDLKNLENDKEDIESRKYINKINHIFMKEPINLKYQLDIVETNDFFGCNDLFEVYTSYKDNKEYVASKNINDFNIDIITLIDNKKILSLEGHKIHIRTLRYFINNKDNNEYLISADDNGLVIVWDISNEYNIKYQIESNYEINAAKGISIFSCLLVFPENNNDNYIVISTNNISKDIDKSATKLYSMNDGNFSKNINNSNNYGIMYLLSWHNKKNNKYYIIQLANAKIIINNLLEDELYCELKHRHEGDLNSGFVFSKDNNDFLCYSSENGRISIWNLYTKKLINKIKMIKSRLMHIIEWNNKYLIVADFDNKTFKVIDLEKKKNNIYDFHDKEGQHTSYVKSIKKIIHPIYGECLLTAGSDKKIKLWNFN